MPNPGAEAPLHKCTLNLFHADYLAMQTIYGPNWTVKVRELIQAHVQVLTRYHPLKKTLGDLDES